MNARGLRLARGWSGAAIITSAAAASHAFSGGGIPSFPIFLLSLALSGLVCTALAGRVLSLWRTVTAVALSQTLYHWLFSADAAASGMTASPADPALGHAGHSMAAMTSALPAPGMAGMDHTSSLMGLSHALAAVFTVALLRRGEVLAVRLLHALRLRLVRLLPFLRPISLGPAITLDSRPVLALPSLGVPLLALRHRGPPLLAGLRAPSFLTT